MNVGNLMVMILGGIALCGAYFQAQFMSDSRRLASIGPCRVQFSHVNGTGASQGRT